MPTKCVHSGLSTSLTGMRDQPDLRTTAYICQYSLHRADTCTALYPVLFYWKKHNPVSNQFLSSLPRMNDHLPSGLYKLICSGIEVLQTLCTCRCCTIPCLFS